MIGHCEKNFTGMVWHGCGKYPVTGITPPDKSRQSRIIFLILIDIILFRVFGPFGMIHDYPERDPVSMTEKAGHV